MKTAVLEFVLAGLLVTACAHNERQVIRLQPGEAVNLQNFDMKAQSLIIELREGEVVPLDILVEGDYFATAPGASVPVTVKKTCFMRVDDRGLRVSDDGVNWTPSMEVTLTKVGERLKFGKNLKRLKRAVTEVKSALGRKP